MEMETIAALTEDSSKSTTNIYESAAAHHQDCLDAAKRMLKKSNTPQRGLIIWLNPGISLDINPEPLHLRNTVQFLKENISYHAGKCDVYDIFDLDVDTQYDMISRQLLNSNTRSEHLVPKLNSEMELVLDRMHATLDQYPAPAPAPAPAKRMQTTLEGRMNDISATASTVFTDILNNRISATDSEGIILHCNVVL
jgi:hypothetical protein